MFCSKCGYQLNDDANFCQKCGAQVQPMQNAQVVSQNRTISGELNRDAIKIHLDDVLALECIRNKMKINLEKTIRASSNMKKWNCLKRYLIHEYNYSNGWVSHMYVHLFFDGSSYYIAMEKEYNNWKVCTGESVSAHCEFRAINDTTIRSVAKWSTHASFFDKRTYTKGLLEAYSDFKKNAPSIYQENLKKLNGMTHTLNGITQELDKVNRLLQKAYHVNIVPAQFRNLYAVYYLHEFISTSRESLATALLHYDLNEIKAKLDKIIEQQQEIIIQQAILAAQNEQLLQQNQSQLERLSAIESNTSHAAQYAEIAAINAEACAWIGLANYIDK